MQPLDRLAEFIEDWKFLARRDGLFHALPVIGLDIARLPYRHMRFLVFAYLLGGPLPDLRSRIELEFRPFELADVKRVRALDRPSEARLCARRLERGHSGLVALHAGLLAGYAWGCDEVNPELERVPIRLEPGDVLCTDVFTAPALRGRGVQTALTLARFRLFADLGYRRAVCYIEERNTPSLAVWKRKLGSPVVDQLSFTRIGAWYRVRFLGAPNER